MEIKIERGRMRVGKGKGRKKGGKVWLSEVKQEE
jgi:hypothetical protein